MGRWHGAERRHSIARTRGRRRRGVGGLPEHVVIHVALVLADEEGARVVLHKMWRR